MGEANFAISTEGLSDKGKEIGKETVNIRQALNDINEARALLEGWVSVNKEKFDNRIANVLPKMNEMVDVIDSYSKVAIQTSDKAIAVENKIANAIDNELFS